MIFEVGRRFGIKEILVVGSAAILAALPNPPEGELTATRDVDVIPPQDDERSEKDLAFARSATKLGLVRRELLRERLALVDCSEEHRTRIAARVDALFSQSEISGRSGSGERG